MGPRTDLSLHSRYYISRHTYGEDGLATETYYRTSTGSWSKFFSDAMLWSDKDFAVEKSKFVLKDQVDKNAEEDVLNELSVVFLDGKIWANGEIETIRQTANGWVK